jgi:CheY-like chemotaxis protein
MSTLAHPQLLGTRVLVVDDDADNREMLAMMLEHSGVVVVTADSAAEALRVLESEQEHERSQVLISDIGLPGEDGFSLLRKVRTLARSRGADIRAIALTGYGRHEDLGPKGEGFQVHLTKPVELEKMLSAILRVLESPL